MTAVRLGDTVKIVRVKMGLAEDDYYMTWRWINVSQAQRRATSFFETDFDMLIDAGSRYMPRKIWRSTSA